MQRKYETYGFSITAPVREHRNVEEQFSQLAERHRWGGVAFHPLPGLNSVPQTAVGKVQGNVAVPDLQEALAILQAAFPGRVVSLK